MDSRIGGNLKMSVALKPSVDSPDLDYSAVRDYYDREYYKNVQGEVVPSHYRRLAYRLKPWQGQRVLDVACGSGMWLRAVAELGAVPAGVDISRAALEACELALPVAELHCGPAERLPFPDAEFDFVSCLGALEHFVDPRAALREMVRVAKPEAIFLILVPNSGFLTRRLGLYSGTQQAVVREEVLSLEGWRELFDSVGLHARHRWRDLHVVSTSWIFRGRWLWWPVRAAQALSLPFWPLSWQYQVYHLCTRRRQLV